MPESFNSYAFYADYSQMATCLFAIQAMEEAGGFASEEEVKSLLSILENDELQRLYSRTLMVLGVIDGNDDVIENYLKGDFDDIDFSEYDFFTGLLDSRNTGYSSRFRTILNVFTELSRRKDEISAELAAAIDEALFPVLDSFDQLQGYLKEIGLNPCGNDVVSSYYNNSSELYLQAAGSDGADGSVAGVHLRWNLAGELGEYHFPKGNYAQSEVGYNKNDDFIILERTPYLQPIRSVLDFSTARPVVNYRIKNWTFVVTAVVNDTLVYQSCQLTFQGSRSL